MAISIDPHYKTLGSLPGVLLEIGRWRFTPGLASTLVALLLLPSLLFLAHWQWQRFQYKTAHQAHPVIDKLSLTQNKANILQAKALAQDLSALEGHVVGLKGRLLDTYTILIDHSLLKGQAGYTVLTALHLESPGSSEHRLILVDRGWIPQGPQRNSLPSIPPVLGSVYLEGQLYPPMQPFKLPRITKQKSPDTQPSWPLRVLAVDLKNLERLLGHPLYPLILRLKPGNPHGFEILPLAQQGGTPALKHLGYALQWFMMALAVLIYYLVINTSFTRK